MTQNNVSTDISRGLWWTSEYRAIGNARYFIHSRRTFLSVIVLISTGASSHGSHAHPLRIHYAAQFSSNHYPLGLLIVPNLTGIWHNIYELEFHKLKLTLLLYQQLLY